MRTALVRLLPATLFALAVPVRAQAADDSSRLTARELGYAGVEAYQSGDYAKANQKLDRAYALLPAPSLGLWSARSLAKLGKLLEAEQRYREVLKLPVAGNKEEVQRQAQADARQELSQLLPRIPVLIFQPVGAPSDAIELTLDGAQLTSDALTSGIRVNPGSHQLEARHQEQQLQIKVNAAEGERRQVPVTFPATRGETAAAAGSDGATTSLSSETSDSGHRQLRNSLAWIGLGAGGGTLVLGTVLGLVAIKKKNNLDDSGQCSQNKCSPGEADRVSSYNSLRTWSAVGLYAGVGLLATGAVLLWVDRPREGSALSKVHRLQRVAIGATPSGVWLGGTVDAF